ARAADAPRALRHDGLRPDRRVARRTLPDAHPLQLAELAVPHRPRVVRRLPADRFVRARGAKRRHLLRALVHDRGRHAYGDHRHAFPARDQGRRHRLLARTFVGVDEAGSASIRPFFSTAQVAGRVPIRYAPGARGGFALDLRMLACKVPMSLSESSIESGRAVEAMRAEAKPMIAPNKPPKPASRPSVSSAEERVLNTMAKPNTETKRRTQRIAVIPENTSVSACCHSARALASVGGRNGSIGATVGRG